MILLPDDLRCVAAFTGECAASTLAMFENVAPDDLRARAAIQAALGLAGGLPRTAAIRQAAWDAHRAFADVREMSPAAGFAARSTSAAAASAFLHPLPHASQTRHILGSATYAARAREIEMGGALDIDVLVDAIALKATKRLRAILRMYPALDPVNGNRTSMLMAALDRALRNEPV